MNPAKIIKKLRKQIPTMRCKEGCFECCGPVIFSKWEWNQVKNKKTAISIHCPYATTKGCEIYSQRPILCRLFGVVQKMPCPHGCKPDKLLSCKKEIEIIVTYKHIMNL